MKVFVHFFNQSIPFMLIVRARHRRGCLAPDLESRLYLYQSIAFLKIYLSFLELTEFLVDTRQT